MENKYTAGPWFQSHREIPNDIDGMYATQVYTGDGETVATLSWYKMPQRKEVIDGKSVLVTGTYREANAKLIAAAPDLLDMLVLCKPALEGHQNNKEGNIIHELIERVSEIIKKATE